MNPLTGEKQGVERGIEYGGTNLDYDPERNKNNEIYGNIIVRTRGVGIRTKGKKPSCEAGDF
jgi:hypothetical protein